MARATRPAPELGDDLWTYVCWSNMGDERRVAKAAQDWMCSLSAMDTLGFEPRAFRMRSDVMPLHHVPHVCTFTSRQGTCNYVWASGLRP